ncbi:MAG: PorV/PorQ family protein [Sedimentisphaerales bacterium]|nr:PorV/PorQ family protein [Sedimentisphaerales bacterium]
MRKALNILLVIAVAAGLDAKQVTKTGTTAATFLKVDTGARAVGIGSAYVSVVDDATAMYWNPAGLARIKGNEAVFSHAKWIADIGMSYAGVAVNLGNLGNVGMGGQFETMDEMERTTILQPDGTGEMFDAGSYAICLSYARNLTDRFSFGMSAKFIHERIYHSTANGAALDIGVLFDTQLHGMKIGMSITNYGTKMRIGGRDVQTQIDPDPTVSGNNENITAYMKTDAFELPLLFRIGISLDVLKGKGNSNLILAMDAMHPNDNVESLNVGIEYAFNNIIFLRAGHSNLGSHKEKKQVIEQLPDGYFEKIVSESKFGTAEGYEGGLSLGAGLKYALSGVEISFDYAYRDFGVLNDIQKFTIGLGF